jgi:hypothetical protein
MPSYYDDWKDAKYTCSDCRWSGVGRELAHGETYRDLFEVECPKCGRRLGTVLFPTLEESRKNWDKVSPADRAIVDLTERREAAFERRRLRSPDQLPDIPDGDIVITWDCSSAPDRETVLKYGDHELWREPAFYEGYMRFVEIVTILTQKYGPQLRDVIPTEASEFYLYGDKLAAPSIVDRCRNGLKAGKKTSDG